MKLWVVAVVVLVLCAGPAWALVGQQWQCNTDRDACNYGHPLTFAWADGGAGGMFSNATLRNPVYAPVENLTGADVVVTLTVTATCTDDTNIHGSGGVPVVVFSESHTITIEATAVPIVVALGESSQLGVSWQWSAEQGRFDDPSSATPRFWPAVPGRVPVRVSGSVESPYPQSAGAGLVLLSLSADGTIFSDVLPDYWAYDEILDVAWRGIVRGYGDGTYQPTWPVDRGQMAVYLSRTFDYLGAPDPLE